MPRTAIDGYLPKLCKHLVAGR